MYVCVYTDMYISMFSKTKKIVITHKAAASDLLLVVLIAM